MISLKQALRLQGLYYLVTGLWPLIHLASFEAVTGPKTDDWLVKMVGLLAAAIGAALLTAARQSSRGSSEILVLAVGSAGAFAAVAGVDGFQRHHAVAVGRDGHRAIVADRRSCSLGNRPRNNGRGQENCVGGCFKQHIYTLLSLEFRMPYTK